MLYENFDKGISFDVRSLVWTRGGSRGGARGAWVPPLFSRKKKKKKRNRRKAKSRQSKRQKIGPPLAQTESKGQVHKDASAGELEEAV